METKYTPDSWMASKYFNAAEWVVTAPPPCSGAARRVIAYCTGTLDEAALVEARARLIAAAPETKKQRDALLEACKQLCTVLSLQANLLADAGIAYIPEYDAAKAAIALAETNPG